MKIRKRVYENVTIETIDEDLSTLVQDKVVFDDIVVKLYSDEINTYFALLEHKKVEVKDEAEEDAPEEIGFENNFNFGGESDSVFDSMSKKTELKLNACLLIEQEGVLFHFCEDIIEIDSNLLTERLSLKKGFKKNELIDNNFEIKKVDRNKALSKFNNIKIADVLEKSKHNITISEIFNNRNRFRVTALELSKENEYTIELSHSKKLRYRNKNKLLESEPSFYAVFSTISSQYFEENDYERFIDLFELIQ